MSFTTKEKKTILLLHGALGTSQDLAPLINLLNQKGHQTLTFDFLGHGLETKWPEEFRISLFSQQLEDYLQTQKARDLIVFGYSMGGYVGLFHKTCYPNSSIKQIITYGTKFDWSEEAVTRELPMLDPDYLLEKFPSFISLLDVKHGSRWKNVLSATAHMMKNLETLDGLTEKKLSEIQIPVRLILGDLDKMVGSAETNLAASCLKKATVQTLSQSRHELSRINLEELRETITNFSL